jgi:hypothetical protein
MSFCHPFTLQILIFSFENPKPNELKLGRKHLWKILSKECTFCYDPLPNKNCIWWPCLLTDQDEMNNFHREHSIDASYQVSVVAMFAYRSGQNEQSLERTIHKCFLPSFSSFSWEVSEEKIKMWKVNGRKHVHQRQFLFLIGQYLKNVLHWNCLPKWTETW